MMPTPSQDTPLSDSLSTISTDLRRLIAKPACYTYHSDGSARRAFVAVDDLVGIVEIANRLGRLAKAEEQNAADFELLRQAHVQLTEAYDQRVQCVDRLAESFGVEYEGLRGEVVMAAVESAVRTLQVVARTRGKSIAKLEQSLKAMTTERRYWKERWDIIHIDNKRLLVELANAKSASDGHQKTAKTRLDTIDRQAAEIRSLKLQLAEARDPKPSLFQRIRGFFRFNSFQG